MSFSFKGTRKAKVIHVLEIIFKTGKHRVAGTALYSMQNQKERKSSFQLLNACIQLVVGGLSNLANLPDSTTIGPFLVLSFFCFDSVELELSLELSQLSESF